MSDPKAKVVALPEVAPLGRFGPAAIDRVINRVLSASIPEDEGLVLNIKATSAAGERLLSAVVASNIDGRWGVAAAGTLDLDDRDDWELELEIVRRFK